MESLQRPPPPEAICPYATFCAAHCTHPPYLSVTVPCLSLLSSLRPPLYYHSLGLCPPSSSLPLSISLSSTFPILSISFICSVLPSLSLFISAGETPQYSKWGCSDPCCGIQNRASISPILCPYPREMCSELVLPPLPPSPLRLLNTPPFLYGVLLRGQKVDCLLCGIPQPNMMLLSTFELKSIAGRLQVSAS